MKAFAQDQKWDTSDVPTLTQKQLELYFKTYMKNFRREVISAGNNATLCDVWTAVLQSVNLTEKKHGFVKFKYFLLSKICWGKKARDYEQRYKNIVEKRR